MWSYYTHHEGFVLEFDYNDFGFSTHGPFQVNYQDKIEPVNDYEGLDLCTLYQANLKMSKWEHEKEWRLLSEKYALMEMPGLLPPLNEKKIQDRKFEYNKSTVKRIILGHRFFKAYDKEFTENFNGFFSLKTSTQLGLKGRLLQFIIKNKIPVYIIVRDTENYKFLETKCEIEDLEHINKNYRLPINVLGD